MADENQIIRNSEELLELRIQLGKYKENSPKQTLNILRRLLNVDVKKSFIKKTRISKTIVRLAQKDLQSNDSQEFIRIISYCRKITKKWMNQFEMQPIKFQELIVQQKNTQTKTPSKQEDNNNNQNHNKLKDKKTPVNKETLEKQSNTSSNIQETLDLPDLNSQIRQQGLKGIYKYLSNDVQLNQQEHIKICCNLESQLFEKINNKYTDQEEKNKEYKIAIKNICGQFNQQQEIRKQILKCEIGLEQIWKHD